MLHDDLLRQFLDLYFNNAEKKAWYEDAGETAIYPTLHIPLPDDNYFITAEHKGLRAKKDRRLLYKLSFTIEKERIGAIVSCYWTTTELFITYMFDKEYRDLRILPDNRRLMSIYPHIDLEELYMKMAMVVR